MIETLPVRPGRYLHPRGKFPGPLHTEINDAHYLDSFDAADELAVGCALLDGGDFDGETDLIEGDTSMDARYREDWTKRQSRSDPGPRFLVL
jgi:hypothetical protein